jgi:SAM-dependent methyltransferase
MSGGATGGSSAPAGGYLIRGGIEGRERLRLISRVLQPTTAALLARVGLGEGMRCLDVGCGGGDVTLELARRVLPGGRALGVDVDDVKLRLARREAAAASADNVDYANLDVVAARFEAEFDLVYARFLLTHMPDAGRVLTLLVRALRPGGVIAVEDIDRSGMFCRPESEAYRRSVALYSETARNRGGDPDIGLRLPGLLVESGCEDVRATVFQLAGFGQEPHDRDVKLVIPVTTETIADAAIEEGFATDEEMKRLVDELYRLAADPHTFMSLPRMVQAWGRRPAEPPAAVSPGRGRGRAFAA